MPVGRQRGAYRSRALPAVVAQPLVFLVGIAGGLGRVANQLAAGPCNEPTGRALPRAKALQHVLSDAGVTKSDEERCVVGADIRLTALVAGRGRSPRMRRVRFMRVLSLMAFPFILASVAAPRRSAGYEPARRGDKSCDHVRGRHFLVL